MSNGWIGVDLDGTLAFYDEWRGPTYIGEPIRWMVERIKFEIKRGQRFKIFTARAGLGKDATDAIKAWLSKIGLPPLEITNVKDFECLELWDDRARQVIPNSGKFVGEK
jgi:hypothetical protein